MRKDLLLIQLMMNQLSKHWISFLCYVVVSFPCSCRWWKLYMGFSKEDITISKSNWKVLFWCHPRCKQLLLVTQDRILCVVVSFHFWHGPWYYGLLRRISCLSLRYMRNKLVDMHYAEIFIFVFVVDMLHFLIYCTTMWCMMWKFCF